MTDLASSAPLLRNTEYRKLWLIGLFCGVIRWLELLAFGLFAVDNTGSPALVALLVVLRLLPLALFGIFIGALSDLISPRRLLLISVMVMGAFTAMMLAITAHHTPPFWLIAGAAFVSGTFWASDLPIRRKMAADLVVPAKLANAMALDGATSNGMRFVGPLVGGVLYQSAGITGIFALGLGCYAISLFLVLMMRGPDISPPYSATVSLLQPVRDAAAAFRYAISKGDIARILAVTVAFNIWGFPYLAMIPVIARENLGLSASEVGTAISIEGLFAFIGAMILMRMAKPQWFRKIYLFANVLLFGIIVGIGLSPTHASIHIGLALGGLCAAGFAAMQSTLIYHVAPPHMRGRFMGLMTICIGTGVIGFANIGLLAQAFGPANAMWIVGLQGSLPLAFIAWRWAELWSPP